MRTSRNQNSVRVHCERVNDGVVSRQILDEVPVWKFPLLDVVWRSRGECVSTLNRKQKSYAT